MDRDDAKRVLLVDDAPAFTSIVADHLREIDEAFDVAEVTSAVDALDHLAENDVECVVSDFDMPGMDGLELLSAARSKYHDLPFILFTGKRSGEIASEAIAAGVTDYLRKGAGLVQYEFLANRIDRAIACYRATIDRRVFRQAVKHASDSIFLTDGDGTIEHVNPAFERMTGFSKEEVIGGTPRLFQSGVHDEAFYEVLWSTILGGDVWRGEVANERKDGERLRVEQTIVPITDESGTVVRFVSVNTELPTDAASLVDPPG